MSRFAIVIAAAICAMAGSPAQARIAHTLQHADPLAEKVELAPINPLINGVPARDGARIAALRARARNQYKPTVRCESDVALGEETAARSKGYSQAGTYVGNLTVLAGGICPAARRGRR
ncbi:MAG: hypothetical protein RIQ46_151 [Pseudomonadota bacterium]|jgi:hypothetical protein